MATETSFDEAVRLHQNGLLAEAERIYRQLLADDPHHAPALHLLGVIHHQRGDHQVALDLIARAIALAPTKAVYQNNYGAALLSLGRYAEARDAFERALSIRPAYADALANLGMAQTSLGQDISALTSFQKALELQPGHPDAMTRLAALFRRWGEVKMPFVSMKMRSPRARPRNSRPSSAG